MDISSNIHSVLEEKGTVDRNTDRENRETEKRKEIQTERNRETERNADGETEVNGQRFIITIDFIRAITAVILTITVVSRPNASTILTLELFLGAVYCLRPCTETISLLKKKKGIQLSAISKR